jgi:hypothetical protein
MIAHSKCLRTALAAMALALGPVAAHAQLPDTLPRQVPAGPGDLAAKVAGVCRIQIAPAYRYLGGQRFILQESADAEQHFYARADSAGKILQLYWFQVESKLPGQSGGYHLSTVATLPSTSTTCPSPSACGRIGATAIRLRAPMPRP